MLTESIIKTKVRAEDLEALGDVHQERYESQPNGITQLGAKKVRSHFMTLWSCVQRRLGVRFQTTILWPHG